jgi:hypothetical protein|tara:strand:+ start:18343 stop:19284 length:942 start_codon:yes stop_codon:yes gene_type:complete
MASEKKNSKKLNNLNYILYFAIVLLIITLGFYFYNFNNGLSADSNKWGTFGDFLGGTLNPIFALFSLFAIIYTIKIQTEELEFSREELEETRKELKESRIAQQEQSESLKLQNMGTQLQIFENTFFQLVDLFSKEKEGLFASNFKIDTYASIIKIHMDSKKVDIPKYIFKNDEGLLTIRSITAYLYILKTFQIASRINYDEFNIKYESDTGSYFGQLYQIIKFIDESNIEYKQRYINILRAQFTKEELEFLFYHCLGSIGKKRFKDLIERYEFFEHIILNDNIEKQLLEYDIKAFGKNEKILEKYNELKSKAQ